MGLLHFQENFIDGKTFIDASKINYSYVVKLVDIIGNGNLMLPKCSAYNNVIIKEQILHIENNYNLGKLNKGNNQLHENYKNRPEDPNEGKGYEINFKTK